EAVTGLDVAAAPRAQQRGDVARCRRSEAAVRHGGSWSRARDEAVISAPGGTYGATGQAGEQVRPEFPRVRYPTAMAAVAAEAGREVPMQSLRWFRLSVALSGSLFLWACGEGGAPAAPSSLADEALLPEAVTHPPP